MYNRKGGQANKDFKRMRILLDSGCGGTLVNRSFVKKYAKTRSTSTTWTTKAGTFETTRKVKCTFTLPEFHQGKDISWTMFVDESDNKLGTYDMIIGRDLLHELGIDLLFSSGEMNWGQAIVPMRDPSELRDCDTLENEIFSMHYPDTTEAARIQSIIDLTYSPQDINAIVDKSVDLTKLLCSGSNVVLVLCSFQPCEGSSCLVCWPKLSSSHVFLQRSQFV
jgi:hypothetical protein